MNLKNRITRCLGSSKNRPFSQNSCWLLVLTVVHIFVFPFRIYLACLFESLNLWPPPKNIDTLVDDPMFSSSQAPFFPCFRGRISEAIIGRLDSTEGHMTCSWSPWWRCSEALAVPAVWCQIFGWSFDIPPNYGTPLTTAIGISGECYLW